MLNKRILVAGCFGYIGNALCQRLLLEGYDVFGIDNFSRIKSVKEVGSYSAIKQPSPANHVKSFKELGNFQFNNFDVSKNYKWLLRIMKKFKPSTIVNLAHQPSAPYSQIDQKHGEYSLLNNILTTNNFLWAINELNPNIHYTTIGSTGEYSHYSNIDIAEGYFKVSYNGRNSNEMLYPRQANSIYHASKISSLYVTEYLTRIWKLKTTEAEQSVVFGSYTDEINKTGINSRLDTDGSFGTVINKFIVQTFLNWPMTIFGEGNHKRGFLSLQNSVDAVMLSIENQPEKGKLRIFNQLSETHSMNNLAEMIKKSAIKHGINATTFHIPSPRKEYTGNHYYKYETDILPSMGYKPTRTIEQEVHYIFDILSKDVPYLQGLNESINKNVEF